MGISYDDIEDFDTIYVVNNFKLTKIYIKFNVPVYVCFMLTLYAAYFLFRLILGRMFNFERHKKSPAKHFHHLVDAFFYGTVLFLFGNYSESFTWITALCVIIGLFCFAGIAELPFAKVDIRSIRTWDIKLKAILVVGVVIILALAGYHIYLANDFVIDADGHRLLPIYLIMLFVVLILIIISSMIVYKYQNYKYPTVRRYVLKFGQRQCIVLSKEEMDAPQSQPQQQSVEVQTKKKLFIEEMPKVAYHLHHWQIFYYLAFFTRFSDVISNISAGLVIGIFMHGISAYGFHDLLEE